MPSSFDDLQSTPDYDGIGALEDASLVSDPSAIDLSQVYVLIDSILPFEACLYYQVLPLFIDGSRLIIGAVNLDDPGAIEYVKKQLSYINYSIGFKEIPSDWHRDLLSKYLNHNAKHRQKSHADTPVTQELEERSGQQSASKNIDQYNTQQTFIVDQPEELTDHEQNLHVFPLRTVQPSEAITAIDETPEHDIPSPPDLPIVDEVPPSVPSDPDLEPLGQIQDPLQIDIDNQFRHFSSARLSTLPPKELTQALLSKVLDEGIGRLYFERQSRTGRILWSRDGILQAVVESVDDRVFQGVISEFKRLTHLSLISVRKPKQVEIERSYEGKRILLRLKVMPGAYGEEATLQVLRGTALRFYQQQQIDRLGRDALNAAQTLQKRLNEIRDRARALIGFQSTTSEALPEIIQLLKQMQSQIEEILSAYEESKTGPVRPNPVASEIEPELIEGAEDSAHLRDN